MRGKLISTAVYTPIGYIETAFPRKFATPRQGPYTPSTRARLRISHLPGDNVQGHSAVTGLQGFSHIWVRVSAACLLRTSWLTHTRVRP